MATIINNPDGSNGNANGGGTGMIFGVIILIVILALFFIYGLPALRGTSKGTTVQVPDKVNVDVTSPTNK